MKELPFMNHSNASAFQGHCDELGQNCNDSYDYTNFSVWERYPSVILLLYEHRPAAYFISKYLLILWMVLGFPGNILAIIVWLQPKMRTSSGFYLATGAMVDLFLLMYKASSMVQKRFNYYLRDNNGLCQLLTVSHFMCQYLHVLLILGFSVERCIAICYPLKRAQFCTKSRALKVISALVLLSLSIAAAQAYFWEIDDYGRCDFRNSVAEGGMISVISIWNFTSEMLLFLCVPFCILAINLHVIAVLRNTRRKKQDFQPTVNRKKFKRTTTCTLISTSFFDMVTELSVSTVHIIWPLFKTGNEHLTDSQIKQDAAWQRYITYQAITNIVYTICVSRYASNFYIYVATGKSFRKELKCLTSKKLLGRGSRRVSTQTSYLSCWK